MKTTISVLIAVVAILYLAEPKIQFNPFKISFESPYIPFAVFFLILSISLFGIHYSIKGKAEGYFEAYELKLEDVQESYINTAYEEGFKDGVKSKENNPNAKN